MQFPEGTSHNSETGDPQQRCNADRKEVCGPISSVHGALRLRDASAGLWSQGLRDVIPASVTIEVKTAIVPLLCRCTHSRTARCRSCNWRVVCTEPCAGSSMRLLRSDTRS